MSTVEGMRLNRRLMTRASGAMFIVAGVGGLVDRVVPGGASFSVIPSLVALTLGLVVLAAGARAPVPVIGLLAPIGVGAVAAALATAPDAGETAALFVLPVLWTAFFFRPAAVVAIVACVALADGIALHETGGGTDAWVDVMVAVSAVALVTGVLARHNDELLERLAGEARTDSLTGLLNRRGFDERATIEVARARREASSIAAVTFDIDHFKEVNDTFGHPVGDRALAHLGEVLARETRETDLAARVGGEEFVVLLPGEDAESALVFAERVRNGVAEPKSLGLPVLGVSAGIAARISPDAVEPLLRDADAALYAAKRAGRGRSVVFREGRAADAV